MNKLVRITGEIIPHKPTIVDSFKHTVMEISLTKPTESGKIYLRFTETNFDIEGIETDKKIGFKEIQSGKDPSKILAIARAKSWRFGSFNKSTGFYDIQENDEINVREEVDYTASGFMIVENVKIARLFFREEEPIKLDALFEALILVSGVTLSFLFESAPEGYTFFAKDFFQDLHWYATKNQILNVEYSNFMEFIKGRVKVNAESLKKMKEDNLSVPTKVLYNLYEKPLSRSDEDSFDLFRLPDLANGLKTTYEKAQAIAEGALSRLDSSNQME